MRILKSNNIVFLAIIGFVWSGCQKNKESTPQQMQTFLRPESPDSMAKRETDLRARLTNNPNDPESLHQITSLLIGKAADINDKSRQDEITKEAFVFSGRLYNLKKDDIDNTFTYARLAVKVGKRDEGIAIMREIASSNDANADAAKTLLERLEKNKARGNK